MRILRLLYGEQQAGRAASVRKILSVLASNVHEATFDIAELLAEAKSTGYFRSWGYETLADYAQKELHIRQRKSQYLVRVVQVCRHLGIERKHYEPVGITKLREITRLNPEDFYFNPKTSTNEKMADHIVQLLADAPDLTADQVEERVKELLGQTGEDEMVWMPAYPVKRAVRDKIILVAQELARRLLGSAGRDSEGHGIWSIAQVAVMEVIYADFIVSNQDTQPPVMFGGQESIDYVATTEAAPQLIRSEQDETGTTLSDDERWDNEGGAGTTSGDNTQ